MDQVKAFRKASDRVNGGRLGRGLAGDASTVVWRCRSTEVQVGSSRRVRISAGGYRKRGPGQADSRPCRHADVMTS